MSCQFARPTVGAAQDLPRLCNRNTERLTPEALPIVEGFLQATLLSGTNHAPAIELAAQNPARKPVPGKSSTLEQQLAVAEAGLFSGANVRPMGTVTGLPQLAFADSHGDFSRDPRTIWSLVTAPGGYRREVDVQPRTEGGPPLAYQWQSYNWHQLLAGVNARFTGPAMPTTP